MRHITADGLALIKRFEGFESEIYRDAAGLSTIGYGHLIREDERGLWDNGISRAEAERVLCADIEIAERAVLRLMYVALSDGQFDALVSFSFNLGAGALQRSTLRRKVNREEHDEAPAEFRRWVWAGGRRLRGLVRRREAEIARYLA